MIDYEQLLYYTGRTRDLRGHRPYLSAKKIAEYVGVNPRTVQQWFAGRRKIPQNAVVQWKLRALFTGRPGYTFELVNKNRYVRRALTGKAQLEV